MSAYWNPTPNDDSWIDSFDPRPTKSWKEITHKEKIDFAKKLWKIDPCFGILDFFYHFPQVVMKTKIVLLVLIIMSHLAILSQAKSYVETNFGKLSEDNFLNFVEEFLKALIFWDNDRMTINKATVGQHKKQKLARDEIPFSYWDKNKISLYPTKNFRQDPHIDVSVTVKNFTEEKNLKKAKHILKL